MLAARVFPGTQVQARLASGGLASGPVATACGGGGGRRTHLGPVMSVSQTRVCSVSFQPRAALLGWAWDFRPSSLNIIALQGEQPLWESAPRPRCGRV